MTAPTRYRRFDRRRLAGRRFTLIELLVSLTVLSIMMLLLFQFITTTQRTWALNEGNQRMYDSQRVALDIIERDLNSAVAISLLDQRIGFYIGDPEQDDFLCCFVSSTDLNENASSRMCEINYRRQGNQLQRLLITSRSPDWDFFNQTAVTNPPWVNQGATDYETILNEGVADFTMDFFRKADDTVPLGRGVVFELPAMAVVTLVLYDPLQVVPGQEPPDSAKRSFSKVVYLDKLIKE